MTTYWQEHGRHGLYQMGDNELRSYILDMLEKLGVKKVLDVGCGSGPLYQLIKQKDIEVKYVGTDYSDSFISLCKKSFPGVRWVVDDMRKMDRFLEDEFDLLVYLHSLDHAGEGWLSALDQAYRVSRKYVIIALWRPFSEGDHNVSSHPEYDDSHLIDFNKDDLDKYINTGFDVIVEKEIETDGKYNYVYILEVKK